jgi:hypothetical protein
MELLTSTHEFFHQVLRSALSTHSLTLRETTEFYLVNLLSESRETAALDEPLSLKLAEAEQAAGPERVRLLKEIGDTALYVCGFFAESLSRRLVSVEFYMALGGAAYGHLASTGRTVSELLRAVFDELACKFPRIVELLTDARSQLCIQSSANVLRLYEQWLHTRSEHLARRLRAAGLILPSQTPQS